MGWFPGIPDTAILAVRQAFGETFAYTPDGGATVTLDPAGLPLTAPFDERFIDVDILALALGEARVRPMLDVRLADLLPTVPAKEDEYTVRGVTYEVSEVRPDGQGAAKLFGIRRA